jgi:hypothetical protein
MDEPQDARDAMNIILGWIRDSTRLSYLHEGRVCLEQFDARNFPQFNVVFSPKMWANSRASLKEATTIHGYLTTKYTLDHKPSAKEADFDQFIRAGKEVRDFCHLKVLELLSERGIRADPDAKQTIRGMWCSWPS